jgi:hypothetical protein
MILGARDSDVKMETGWCELMVNGLWLRSEHVRYDAG